jgi:competence protein ComEA
MASPRTNRAAWLTHPLAAPVLLGVCLAFVVAGVALGMTQLGWGKGSVAHQAGTPSAQISGGTVTAYIVGAVQHPAVYTLPDGSRVQDLVNAAGGVLPGADTVRVNMAAKVFDGEEVYVPLIGEPFPDQSSTGVKVNINLASAETMRTQLSVSAKTAQAIVTYRQQHGNFTSVDQLLLVPISKTIYDRIKLLVTV